MWDEDIDYGYEFDDPYMPKPTCTYCAGSGIVLDQDGKPRTCFYYGGTGATR